MAEEVAVLGVGMHPWGKWGRNFVEYGVKAARDALKDAGVEWTEIQLVAGGDTVRNGYPGYVAGATFAEAMGWTGAQVASSYGACATGAQAINSARAQILAGLCDVALVVGADAAPKGFFGPTGGARPDDPDWLRFHLLGATNPIYFGLYARRRMEEFGATELDFAKVKVKNSQDRFRRAVIMCRFEGRTAPDAIRAPRTSASLTCTPSVSRSRNSARETLASSTASASRAFMACR